MQSPETPKRSGTVVYEWSIMFGRKAEQVIVLDPVVLVRAQSKNPTLRVYYVVEDNRCSCAGFQFRHTCRHLAVAKRATETIELIESPFIDFYDAKEKKRGKKRENHDATQAAVQKGVANAP